MMQVEVVQYLKLGRKRAMLGTKSKYMSISYGLRKQLIRLIEEEKMKVSEAAKKLGIKDSTARAIYTKFHQEKTIFESKKEAKERSIIEEYASKMKKKDEENKRKQVARSQELWVEYMRLSAYWNQQNMMMQGRMLEYNEMPEFSLFWMYT